MIIFVFWEMEHFIHCVQTDEEPRVRGPPDVPPREEPVVPDLLRLWSGYDRPAGPGLVHAGSGRLTWSEPNLASGSPGSFDSFGIL